MKLHIYSRMIYRIKKYIKSEIEPLSYLYLSRLIPTHTHPFPPFYHPLTGTRPESSVSFLWESMKKSQGDDEKGIFKMFSKERKKKNRQFFLSHNSICITWDDELILTHQFI